MTLRPFDWNAALHPGVNWKQAYATVALEARAHLLKLDPSREPLSTNELVEALYPEALSRGEGITARKRIYKALFALAEHSLADCATQGAAYKNRMGQTRRPWSWHYPKEPDQYSKIAEATGADRATVKKILLFVGYTGEPHAEALRTES